ncbi:MAM and LDL-receptor class A domain-containing protein 1-like [Glandiceps talaboti]
MAICFPVAVFLKQEFVSSDERYKTDFGYDDGKVSRCNGDMFRCGSWVQSTDDSFEFTRQQGETASANTGPSGDHTKGVDGYYMYIENSEGNDAGDSARLNSPSVSFSANQPKCLSFWYNMYGAHIGSLNVYLKSSTLGSTVWSRKTTYGDKWIQAKVNLLVSSDVSRIIVLEAVQGYNILGDIAIDDITFQNGYCSPANMSCDFENGLCGGTHDVNGNFNWTVIRGDANVGPALDHTYKAISGHYLYADASSSNTGQVARYISKTFTTVSSRCLQFFYARSGVSMAVLSVRIQIDDSMSHPVWTRDLELGDSWNLAQVSLRQQSNFAVVFEIVRTNVDTGYVALDDFQILDGDCKNPTECNFEDGRCSWTNSLVDDDIYWIMNMGATGTADTGPSVDHTTGLDTGTYLLMDAVGSSTNVKAKLYSEILLAKLSYRCLEFWYYMYGGDMGTLQVDITIADDPDSPYTIWTLSGDQNDKWNYGKIPFKALKESQVIFIATHGAGSKSDIALDDIVISNGYCIGAPIGATVHPPTVAPTPSGNPCGTGKFTCTNGVCIDASKYCNFARDCTDNSDEADCPTTCDFQINECGWSEGTPNDKYNWHRASGYETKVTPDIAPRYDHSSPTKSLYSYYSYISMVGAYVYPYETAEYYSPTFALAASTCRIDFWWYQMGIYTYHFEVWIKADDSETKVFSYYGTKGDQWNNLVLGIGKRTTPWQVAFKKNRYSAYHAATAVDDVKFLDCSPAQPVGFCDTSGNFWCTTTRACIDKTAVCDMQDDCGDNSDEQHCESYEMCDFQTGPCSWTQASDTDQLTWIRGRGSTATVYTGPSFDHTYANTAGYYMYIDGYTNSYGKTAQLVSPIYQRRGECKFRVFHHMYGQHIGRLTIYTRIYQNSNQGQTKLWEQVGEKGSYWDKAEATITITTKFQIVIEAMAGDFLYGDIAIDDMSFTPGCILQTGPLPTAPATTPPPVPPSPTPHPACEATEFYCSADSRCIGADLICNFRKDCSDGEEELQCVETECDFESGSCGWLGVWVEPARRRRVPEDTTFKWDRQQGKTKLTSDYRPATDHTYGTENGYYLFADNSPGQFQDTAQVTSPVFGRTGPNCYMELYYHMGGNNVGSIQVLIAVGNSTYVMWSISGRQGEEWHKALVYIGSKEDFKVILQASRASSYYGDECLDDISFKDCAPPVITGADCSTSEFRCANNHCIDINKKCNFEDDCMDNTDEEFCDLPGRCPFEKDTCDWFNEGGDNFDWTLAKGGTLSPGTGPSHDHTTRSDKGGYLFIESNYPNYPWFTARIASPTISKASQNCKISFWYHMYGIHIGTLAVYVRTSYDGDPDNGLELMQNGNMTGDEGDFWWQYNEPIDSGGKDFKIVIEAMVGSSYLGDIAIDDLTFSDGCMKGGKVPGEDTQPPHHDTCDDDARKLSCDSGDECFYTWERCNFDYECSDKSDEKGCGTRCDFENGQCGWENVIGSQVEWALSTGPAYTINSGPDVDHTLSTAAGHFMLFKSYTRSTYLGHTGFLKTLPYQHSGENCQMSFWYHQYGLTMGSMDVYLKYADHTSSKLWNMVGDQGKMWKKATVNIGKQDEFSIVFEGVRGSSIYGDIGIDDIEFINCYDMYYDRPCDPDTEFQCVGDKSCLPLKYYCDYGPPDCTDGSDEEQCLVKPGDCHFDDFGSNGWCSWEQYNDDDFDWSLSKMTLAGPAHDHTTINTTGDSQFAYTDSSTYETGAMGRISTPSNSMFPASRDLCFIRFWYYMYSIADGVGTLKLYTESNERSAQRFLMWQKHSTQGDRWNYANVVIGNTHSFKVVFEVIMGNTNASDIAIDDVTFTESCLHPDNDTLVGICRRNHLYCPGDGECISKELVDDGEVDCPADCYDETEYRNHCELLTPIPTEGPPATTSVGVIIGGAIGGLVFAVLIIGGIIFGVTYFRAKTSSSFSLFNSGKRSEDKVTMSDVSDPYDVSIEKGQDAYAVDNPMYGGMGIGSMSPPKYNAPEANA